MATQLDNGFQSLQARAYTQETTDIKKNQHKKPKPQQKKAKKPLAIPFCKFSWGIFQTDGKSAKTSLPGPIMQQVGLQRMLQSHNQCHLDVSVKYLQFFKMAFKIPLPVICKYDVFTSNKTSDLTKNCGSISQSWQWTGLLCVQDLLLPCLTYLPWLAWVWPYFSFKWFLPTES